MDWADYLRDQAVKYRQLAEQTDDPVVKSELLELGAWLLTFRHRIIDLQHRLTEAHGGLPLTNLLDLCDNAVTIGARPNHTVLGVVDIKACPIAVYPSFTFAARCGG